MPDTDPFRVQYYHREKQALEEEQVYEAWFKRIFYGTAWGRVFVHLVFKQKCFSKLYGLTKRSTRSTGKIPAFVERYKVNTEEIARPIETFRSLNDFFTRELKISHRPFPGDPVALPAPCDSRLYASPIQRESIIPIKGREISIFELVRNESLIRPFENGLCLVFRLVPADCHRFFYIDDGVQGPIGTVDGCLHATSPAAMIMARFPILLNHRQYCRLETANFGDVLQVEIGAMAVGTICQNNPNGGPIRRGDEKGHFEFGGSTIVLLFGPDVITIDEDIMCYSRQKVETLVKYGADIGHASAGSGLRSS